ncbi:MAG: excinuclease ABC subunit UvrC [Dissulfurimicrobium sp.]|uniref:excinuclease ABC subunit UvrC n=1 Tax=Dissulfurimicrobium sp. TaxID=2022436 RepID=UPI00404B60AF
MDSPIRLKCSAESLYGIPRSPGIYIFRNEYEEVLYVGKAKDLRQRLTSYLRPSADIPDKTSLMLKKAKTLEFIATITEKEALILEASLIKQHRPRYNILLRDDKTYPFLRLDIQHEFPKLSIVRRRERDGALYFGPYPSGMAVRETYRFITTIFGLRTCSDARMSAQTRPCLKYQTKHCCAPCIKAISGSEYRDRIKEVRLFLEGKTSALLEFLSSQMTEAASRLEFEKAAMLRDRIDALKKITERQWVVIGMDTDLDAIGIAKGDGDTIASVIRVKNGVVTGQELHHLISALDEDDRAILAAFLREYYDENSVPPEIILPFEPADSSLLYEWLSERGLKKLNTTQVRGERRRLMDMARQNAVLAFTSAREKAQNWQRLSGEIKTVLALKVMPSMVEGVDISTTGGDLSIGSLVSFKDGMPYKKGYRHYNIKETIGGIDDYAMIREVITRRIKAGLETGKFPDLLLIDGGRGQLNEAADVISSFGLLDNIELVSLAKAKDDEGEKIYRTCWPEPLFLPRSHPVLLFLQRVRDEAHRFGVTFHRKKRNKAGLRSRLRDIPGIGPTREQRLLKHFGSVKRIKEASIDELAKAASISNRLAHEILERLNRL